MICVEVGVFRGHFASEILKREPQKLYLVDTWRSQNRECYNDPSNVSDAEFEDIFRSVERQFLYDSRVIIKRVSSFEAAPQLSDIDFVYLDANHNFADTLCDLCFWHQRLRDKGGWLCGHDYTGAYPGVRQAVDNFCRITGLNIDILTTEKEWASYGIEIT
jgi:hypothetical protein